MNFSFDRELAVQYHSGAQKIRVMSESWVADSIFCPHCGNPHITNLVNNAPVADFMCEGCGEIFELKSKRGRIDTKILDGAYDTMIQRITNNENTDLFVLQYSDKLEVVNMLLVPKFFFTPDIIEKRKPLPPTARRAGWVGCNIMVNCVPKQGKISIISNQQLRNSADVVEEYNRIKLLQTNDLHSRGWLFDVLNCVNSINKTIFDLNDIYFYAEGAVKKGPNRNDLYRWKTVQVIFSSHIR